jgi:hypothetical protein
MMNRGDTLTVDCADYSVNVRKGKIVLSAIGGTLVHWHFDASMGDFVMANVERWRPQM